MKRLFLLLVLFGPAFLSAGCGGEDVVEPTAPAPTTEEIEQNEDVGAVPEG